MYTVMVSNHISEDGVAYTGYGLVSDSDPLLCVRDLSTDREAVEKTAHLCNIAGVPDEHIFEIAEDFLACITEYGRRF